MGVQPFCAPEPHVVAAQTGRKVGCGRSRGGTEAFLQARGTCRNLAQSDLPKELGWRRVQRTGQHRIGPRIDAGSQSSSSSRTSMRLRVASVLRLDTRPRKIRHHGQVGMARSRQALERAHFSCEFRCR